MLPRQPGCWLWNPRTTWGLSIPLLWPMGFLPFSTHKVAQSCFSCNLIIWEMGLIDGPNVLYSVFYSGPWLLCQLLQHNQLIVINKLNWIYNILCATLWLAPSPSKPLGLALPLAVILQLCESPWVSKQYKKWLSEWLVLRSSIPDQSSMSMACCQKWKWSYSSPTHQLALHLQCGVNL